MPGQKAATDNLILSRESTREGQMGPLLQLEAVIIADRFGQPKQSPAVA